jgi:hypothetical protein
MGHCARHRCERTVAKSIGRSCGLKRYLRCVTYGCNSIEGFGSLAFMKKRRLMLASLRYLDTFVKLNGAWLFSERLLYVDWTDERALS